MTVAFITQFETTLLLTSNIIESMKMTKTFLLSMLLACTGCTEEINTKKYMSKEIPESFPIMVRCLPFLVQKVLGDMLQVDVVEKYIALLILMMMVKVLFEMR